MTRDTDILVYNGHYSRQARLLACPHCQVTQVYSYTHDVEYSYAISLHAHSEISSGWNRPRSSSYSYAIQVNISTNPCADLLIAERGEVDYHTRDNVGQLTYHYHSRSYPINPQLLNRHPKKARLDGCLGPVVMSCMQSDMPMSQDGYYRRVLTQLWTESR